MIESNQKKLEEQKEQSSLQNIEGYKNQPIKGEEKKHSKQVEEITQQKPEQD